MTIEYGCSPTTWGVDFADNPANPPWESVLDDIAAAGCHWLELGPVGYLPTERATLSEALAERDLRTIGTFIFQPIWDPEAADVVAATVHETCRTIADQGGTILVIVDQVNPNRNLTAARSDHAGRLPAEEWAAHLARVQAVAEQAVSYGLRPVLHPHIGTYIEFADEIERSLAQLPRDLIGLCIDTGHLALAGVDPAQAILDYGDRVDHVHLKDVNPDVRLRVVQDHLSFWKAVDLGVFCPIGQGTVDFRAVLRALDRIGFRGVAIVEQDRNPRSRSQPRDDLDASLRHLRATAARPSDDPGGGSDEC